MARLPAILGIVGGVLGLLTSVACFIYFLVIAYIARSPSSFLFIPILDGLGAVVGIAGGVVSLRQVKVGGAFILAGAATGSIGWLVALGGILETSFWFFFWTMSIFYLWWATLLLVGGLIAVLRARAPGGRSTQQESGTVTAQCANGSFSGNFPWNTLC